MITIFSKHPKGKNEGLLSLNFDQLNELLLSLGVINTKFTKEQQIVIEFPNIDIEPKKFDGLDNLEALENDNGFKIQTKLYTYEIDINNLFALYKEKNSHQIKNTYDIDEFTIIIKVLTSIISSFNDDFFKFDLNKHDLFNNIDDKEKIKFASLKGEEESIKLLKKVENLYKEIEYENEVEIEEEFEEQSPILNNLFFIVNIFTIFGKIQYKNVNIDIMKRNIDIYNSILCSDIKMLTLIHFGVVILFHLIMNKKIIANFLDNTKVKTQDKPGNSFIPTFFYCDENSLKQSSLENIKNQILIKLHFLQYLLSNVVVNINFHIVTFDSLKKQIEMLGYRKEIESLYNEKKFQIEEKELVDFLENAIEGNLFYLNLNRNLKNDDIMKKLNTFFNVIVNSNVFKVEVDELEDKNVKYPFSNYYYEIDILVNVLKFFHKVKSTKSKRKKPKDFSLSFKYDSFILLLKKSIDLSGKPKREMHLLIMQKYYKEEEFLGYLSKQRNLSEMFNIFKNIILQFAHFKHFSSYIHLSENEMQNPELNFYLSSIYLNIQNYINENLSTYKHISLYESKIISPSNSLIVNTLIKQKDRSIYFSKHIKNIIGIYMHFITKMYNEFQNYFDTIIVHYEKENNFPFNPRILLRNFSENILIIIVKQEGNADIMIYLSEISERKNYHEIILQTINKVRKNESIREYINKVTLFLNKKLVLQNYYFDNSQFFISSNINSIYFIDRENQIDCYFEKKRVILHYYSKVESYITAIIIAINSYFEVIKYIAIIKKYNVLINIAIVFNKKIFYCKNGSFIIKKISANARDYQSVINDNIFKCENSYPFFILLAIEDNKNPLTLENIIDTFEKFFYPSTNPSIEETRKIFFRKIYPNIYMQLTPVVLNEKYYKIFQKFCGNRKEKFDKGILVLLTNNELTKNTFNTPFSNRLMVYRFINSKFKIYSMNDIGKAFTLGKITNTLQYLSSNQYNILFSQVLVFLCIKYYIKRNSNCKEEDIKNISLLILSFIPTIYRKSSMELSNIEIHTAEFEILEKQIQKYKNNATTVDDEEEENKDGSISSGKKKTKIQKIKSILTKPIKVFSIFNKK